MEKKVFISWSKQPAKQIARCVKDLIVGIVNLDENMIFISDEIERGRDFNRAISSNLTNSTFGILILTDNNFGKEWLMFESGALLNNNKEGQIVPFLINRDIDQLESPILVQNLNLVKFNYDDVLRLINDIYRHIFERPNNRNNAQLLKGCWAQFEMDVNACIEKERQETEEKQKLSIEERSITDVTSKNVYDIMMDDNVYEKILARRDSHLVELIGSLNTDSSKRIIIFGGISTTIRDKSTIIEFACWKTRNPDSKLFICHEDENVALERAKDINNEAFIGVEDKTTEVKKRKVDQTKQFKDILFKHTGLSFHENIKFIELSQLLTIYVTVQGTTVYITPVLDKRSSATFTFKLSDARYVVDVLLYMKSKITAIKEDDQLLLQEIDLILEEVDADWVIRNER